jgi:hypothetical protein
MRDHPPARKGRIDTRLSQRAAPVSITNPARISTAVCAGEEVLLRPSATPRQEGLEPNVWVARKWTV